MNLTERKVLILLGSGISLGSGLPNVRELTNDILNGSFIFSSDQKFYPESFGILPSLGEERVAKNTQRFLQLLKTYSDRYYAIRTGQESHYEDIYYLAKQLADDQTDNIQNPAIDGFIRDVREQAEPLFRGIYALERARYQQMADRSCALIESVLAHRLQLPKEIKGLDLLTTLALNNEIVQLDVTTLNHDTLVETHLGRSGCEIQDGFSKIDGDLQIFDPAEFDYPKRIRLLKLHGSIDWYRFYLDKKSQMAKVSHGDIYHAKDKNGKLINLDGPNFLAGTFNKILDYGSGIFGEQFFRFHQFLKEHDRLIISGYGFGDKAINTHLWDWLCEKSNRKMIVLHEDPKSLFLHARASFSNVYDRLKEIDQIVIIEKWMSNASFDTDISHLL
ncbi:MAG TPA: SIR2 family protein [Opitutales bacterium]|jgi:hypothetical protein|nr:SIR2 family protein [Opitutales bacterium]